MRGRVILAVLLLLLLLGGGLYFLHVTNRLCTKLAQDLTDGRFEDSLRLWKSSQPLLSALVTHDRVDEISACYARADAFRSEDTEDEYKAEVQTILVLLSLLRDYDLPTVRSIL